jgi:hypothetical protein
MKSRTKNFDKKAWKWHFDDLGAYGRIILKWILGK